MAIVKIEISDIDGPHDGVSFTMTVDREGENERLSPFPATPAMIVGLAILEAYNEGGLDEFSQKVVDKVLAKTGLSPEQIKEAEARALAAFSAASSK